MKLYTAIQLRTLARDLRLQQGLSTSMVAKRIGRSMRQVQRAENDTESNMNTVLEIITHLTGHAVNELYGVTDPRAGSV